MIWTKTLRAFEADVAEHFNRGDIRSPVHLSGGNEQQLIDYFDKHYDAMRGDWVLTAWRSHYHALLAGVDPDEVLAAVMRGRSITLCFPKHRFLSSAIVGGILPIAVGIAMAIKRRPDAKVMPRVHVFVGDMTAMGGAMHEAMQYARGHFLPINFVIEDNGKSVGTPTKDAWEPLQVPANGPIFLTHLHDNPWPHAGAGQWVRF